MKVRLTLNAKDIDVDVDPRTSLADLLRAPEHGCTSIHLGCEHGVCGACTILIDGHLARSCITLAVACDELEITTLEGLEQDVVTSELKDSFQKNHGLQCGFCTPGMIISAREIINANFDLDENLIRQEMSGNLCRCTGYSGIVASIIEVAENRMKSAVQHG